MAFASTSIEVDIDISASEVAADPSVGWPGGYEDITIDGLYALKHVRFSRPSQWKRIDLLAGLDDKAKAIVLQNVLNAYGEDEAVERLNEEASDPMADRADDLRDQRRDDDLLCSYLIGRGNA